MRTLLTLVAVLYSATAFAQTAPAQDTPVQGTPAQSSTPTVGGKPLVQVKPRTAAASKGEPQKPQSVAQKLQACLDIDDATKERLICYDAIFPPKPNPKAKAAKAVTDCRAAKEEDDRLTCYNGFAEKIPKLPK